MIKILKPDSHRPKSPEIISFHMENQENFVNYNYLVGIISKEKVFLGKFSLIKNNNTSTEDEMNTVSESTKQVCGALNSSKTNKFPFLPYFYLTTNSTYCPKGKTEHQHKSSMAEDGCGFICRRPSTDINPFTST